MVICDLRKYDESHFNNPSYWWYPFVPISSACYAPPSETHRIVYQSANENRNSFGETSFKRLQSEFTISPVLEEPNFVDPSSFNYDWLSGETVSRRVQKGSFPEGSAYATVHNSFAPANCYAMVIARSKLLASGKWAMRYVATRFSVGTAGAGFCIYFSNGYTEVDDVTRTINALFTELGQVKSVGYRDIWRVTENGKPYTYPPIPKWLLTQRSVEDMTAMWRGETSEMFRRQILGEALISVTGNAQTTDVVNLENVIQTIESVRSLPTLARSIQQKVRYLSKPTIKKVVKEAADAKLSYDYSVKTTVSDLKELAHSFSRRSRDYSIARGRHSDVATFRVGDYSVSYSLSHSFKVYYGDVDESTIPFYRTLQNIGLDPSFEHVWNVIPYSFVVDWVLPISKVWQQIDYNSSVATLPIRAVTHSTWERFTFRSGSISGTISSFNRELGDSLPSFPHFLPSMSPNMNWTNGMALIVQRMS